MPGSDILVLGSFQVHGAEGEGEIDGPAEHEIRAGWGGAGHKILPALQFGVEELEEGHRLAFDVDLFHHLVHGPEEEAEEEGTLLHHQAEQQVHHQRDGHGGPRETAQHVLPQTVHGSRVVGRVALEGTRHVERVQEVLGAGRGFDQHPPRRRHDLRTFAQRVCLEQLRRRPSLARPGLDPLVQHQVVVERVGRVG